MAGGEWGSDTSLEAKFQTFTTKFPFSVLQWRYHDLFYYGGGGGQVGAMLFLGGGADNEHYSIKIIRGGQ